MFKLVRYWMLFVVVCIAPSVYASQSIPLPITTVGVSRLAGVRAIQIDLNNSSLMREPHNVSGSIDLDYPVPAYIFPAGVDIYFGVFLPGGAEVATWSPNAEGGTIKGGVTLKKGYAPLVRSKSLAAAFTLDAYTVNGNWPILYKFAGTETKGLYMLFMFMVEAGQNPANVKSWMSVSTAPFFVE
jgi:hypothetical protein